VITSVLGFVQELLLLAEAGHHGKPGHGLELADPCETWYGSQGNRPGKEPMPSMNTACGQPISS